MMVMNRWIVLSVAAAGCWALVIGAAYGLYHVMVWIW